MAQYGGYKEYMEAIKAGNAGSSVPQIIIEAPALDDEEDNDCKELTDTEE